MFSLFSTNNNSIIIIIFVRLKGGYIFMINWNNLDTLASFKELKDTKAVDLVSAMSGESGADRVKSFNTYGRGT